MTMLQSAAHRASRTCSRRASLVSCAFDFILRDYKLPRGVLDLQKQARFDLARIRTLPTATCTVNFFLVMAYIHVMNLRSIDLNLIVILDSLLSERSVTRAARRLYLS